MTTPHACPDCLRRSWLLAALGPYIERAAGAPVGRRAPRLLRLGDEELADTVAPGDGRRLLATVAAHREHWFAERLAEADCWAACRHDGAYPGGLRDLGDAPCALIGRGDPSVIRGLGPQAAVTIVGSRRADSYGREVARDLGADLAAAGLSVISGLAFGIDACAHRGALDAGGTTIAVLGCGPDTAYPAAHRGLWRRIAEAGAVISELPPGSVPWRWSFPARSRVMAALAGMTVVVEAAARSGSLVAADVAAELGREVGAVPGPVISRSGAGPNALLADGACVVRDGQDVLDALSARPARAARCPERTPPLTADHDMGPAAAAGGPACPSRGGATGAPPSLRGDAEAALAEAVAAHGETGWSCASLTDWIVDGLRRRGDGRRAVYHESPHGHSYVVVHSDGVRWIVDAWEPDPLPVRVKIWRHGEVPADQEPEAYGGPRSG